MAGTSPSYISRLIYKKDSIVNKVCMDMLEKLGCDIQITLCEEENKLTNMDLLR